MHTLTRRSVLTGTLATSIALALAACSDDGGGDAGTSATIAPDTKAELTLAYWDKSQTPTIDANIKSFNETYPNITVTTNLTAYADYWKKLRTQAEGRTLPDVMWMNGPNIQLYAGNDMLEPLDDVTAAGIAWSDYPTSLVDLYTYQGVHYAIPKDYDTIGVFYNKTLFASAGAALPTEDWTWEDFHTAARTISAWGKDQGIWGCATTVNGDGQGTYYNTIAQAGGYVIKDGRSGFDDPASVKGLQCWADWIADGSVAPPAVVADTKPESMFTSGKSAMLWAGDWQCAPIAEAFAGRLEEVDVAPLPQGEKRGSIIHGLGWAVARTSGNKAAAKALAAHMASRASQETEARNGTAIPAFNGTQAPWLETYSSWSCRIFTEAASTYAVTYPVSKNTSAWADHEGDYLTPAFAGQTTVTDAASQLATFMNGELAKEG